MSRATCIVVITCVSTQALAFDPFTIATGARAVAGLTEGVLGGGLDEASEAAFALGDLMVEVDVDPTMDIEAKDNVRRLEELQSKVREAKWTKAEFEQVLGQETMKSKSHAERIRQLQRIVQMTKRVSTIFGVRPKAAEKASQIQQTQISYLILEELMAARRERLKVLIDEQDLEIQRRTLLRNIEDQEKTKRSESWWEHLGRKDS